MGSVQNVKKVEKEQSAQQNNNKKCRSQISEKQNFKTTISSKIMKADRDIKDKTYKRAFWEQLLVSHWNQSNFEWDTGDVKLKTDHNESSVGKIQRVTTDWKLPDFTTNNTFVKTNIPMTEQYFNIVNPQFHCSINSSFTSCNTYFLKCIFLHCKSSQPKRS